MWQQSSKRTADQPVPRQLLQACSWLPSANPNPANSYLPYFHLTVSEFTFQGTAVTLVMTLIPSLWSFYTSLCVSHSLSICPNVMSKEDLEKRETYPKLHSLLVSKLGLVFGSSGS